MKLPNGISNFFFKRNQSFLPSTAPHFFSSHPPSLLFLPPSSAHVLLGTSNNGQNNHPKREKLEESGRGASKEEGATFRERVRERERERKRKILERDRCCLLLGELQSGGRRRGRGEDILPLLFSCWILLFLALLGPTLRRPLRSWKKKKRE